MSAEGTLGSRIKECRKILGLTQEELGVRMNITKSMISYYEHDNGDMKKSLIAEFAKVLETTYEYLACGIVNNLKLDERSSEALRLFSLMDDLTKDLFLKQMRAVV